MSSLRRTTRITILLCPGERPINPKEFNTATCGAFPDIHFTIEDMVAEGDKVVYRGSARGTHKGEFMGIAATGKHVTFTSIVISRIAKGKFQEDWESLDGT